MCQNHFKQNLDKLLGHLSKSGTVEDEHVRSLFFGDYMNPENKVYDEVTDLKELTITMEQWVVLVIYSYDITQWVVRGRL